MTPAQSPIDGNPYLRMPHSINHMLNHHERPFTISERKFRHVVIYNVSTEDISLPSNATVGKCCYILQQTNDQYLNEILAMNKEAL